MGVIDLKKAHHFITLQKGMIDEQRKKRFRSASGTFTFSSISLLHSGNSAANVRGIRCFGATKRMWMMMYESEWQTRKTRIDKQLRSLNPAWEIIPYTAGLKDSDTGVE